MRFHLTAALVLVQAAVSGNAIAESSSLEQDDPGAQRVTAGLLALYDFSEGQGRIVKDRASVGQPMNLRIRDSDAVQWHAGALEVRRKTLIDSGRTPARISEAIRRSGAITIEAWVQPKHEQQSGPARIFTLSRNGTNRNFTLGQDGAKFDVRFRTSETNSNGIPSLSSTTNSLTTKLTHVVYTRSRDGKARLFLDGQLNANREVRGSTRDWDNQYTLAIANEQDQSRTWLGTYYLLALYRRDLSSDEVAQNFQAGPGAESVASLARDRRDPRELHFELRVAPLLADNCLECHDSASREGGLDLSRKATALAGGDTGPALVAGNLAESLLWTSVEADEMPHERPPLEDAEKEQLKKWIADGAAWSLEMVDPAVYVHGSQPAENWVRRLTVAEYIETVRATFDVDISVEARKLLPRDLRADGFSNTAYNLNVDLKHVNAYGELAERIVARLDVQQFARRFSKSRRFTDDDMGNLIRKMGQWVLRGPIEDHELISYRGISTSVAAAGGDFDEAVSLILEAMLQSPRFLYRMEEEIGDGTRLPLKDSELAARISYIIWGSPPDDALLEAAKNGELADPIDLYKQVDRMLQDPRAVQQSLRFIGGWLNLARLENLQPNRERFPDWEPELGEDMRAETLAVFEEIVWRQKRPLADVVNAPLTFLTPRLAKHYGLEPVSQDLHSTDLDSTELIRYDLKDNPTRGGILTQGSVLTAGGDHASMVTRGLLVMHELLRGVVKAPPPCVDTTPVPTKAGLTQRAIAEARIADSNCGGCHSRFEPLAFGLEKYDGLGRYAEHDRHGNKLREDGEILVPGSSQPVKYQDVSELMDFLAGHQRVRQTMTWKLTQFALGRPLGAADAADVDKIHKAATEGGGTYQSLMKAIVSSDLVQMIRTENVVTE